MKTRYKIFTALTLASSSIVVLGLLNHIIKINATVKNLLVDDTMYTYEWRFGKINYKKLGSGPPLLLIHHLDPSSSTHEWNHILHALSMDHTVYAIDLLGCGSSEKPYITYTNFLLMQLVTDFIKSEIGRRTSIVVTGASSTFCVSAVEQEPEMFDKLILISPENPKYGLMKAGKRSKTYKSILNTPVIGTLLYHIAVSRENIIKKLENECFFNAGSIPKILKDTYYESAHAGSYPKSLYASLVCNYTKFNIRPTLANINNTIVVIVGEKDAEGAESARVYHEINPSVEIIKIPHSKKLPQLEASLEFLKQLEIFL